MKTIQVSFVDLGKTGKSVRIKDKENNVYFAKPEQGIKPNTTIEAEVEESEYQGKTNYWIKSYKVASVGPSAPSNGNAAPQNHTNGRPSDLPWWMPFVSNCCGNGLRSGVIDSPEKLKAYAIAAHQVAHQLRDDIPF